VSRGKGMVMDWREMAGRATVRGLKGAQRWDTLTGVWSGGRKIGNSGWDDGDQWRGRLDPMRGWVIAASWLFTFTAECVLPSLKMDNLSLRGPLTNTLSTVCITFTIWSAGHGSSSTSRLRSSSTTSFSLRTTQLRYQPPSSFG
jgi:hypothetical protein